MPSRNEMPGGRPSTALALALAALFVLSPYRAAPALLPAGDLDGRRSTTTGQVPVLEETQILVPGDPDEGHWFGGAVGVSGDTLAVSAILDDQVAVKVAVSGASAVTGAWAADGPFDDSGEAYAFEVGNCLLELGLDRAAVRRGEELTVAIHLRHDRPVTVTVPLALWIEDHDGALLVSTATSPQTFHPGDELHRSIALRIPADARPGLYRIVVGVSGMEQGIAWAERVVRVAR